MVARSEIKSHTAIRGIAALLVVVYHFRPILAPAIDLDAHTQFFAKGYLWVSCFFMLSGFILANVYGLDFSWTRFWRARFARIYPLHLATLLLLAALNALLVARGHAANPSMATFALNALDIHAWGFLDAYDWNFPSWSISVEFAAYLLFPAICFGVKRYRSTAVLMLVAAFALTFIFPQDHEHWERTAALYGLAMFGAGILLHYLPVPKLSPWLQFLVAASTALLLHFGADDRLIVTAFAALIFATRRDDGLSKVLNAAPLMALGAWSYSIYMLHIPVRALLAIVAPHAPPSVMFPLLIASTLIAGAASYYMFEMPARRLINGATQKRATPAKFSASPS